MKLIFEKSVAGRQGARLSESDVPVQADIRPDLLRETPAALPELSELDVAWIRDFIRSDRAR